MDPSVVQAEVCTTCSSWQDSYVDSNMKDIAVFDTLEDVQEYINLHVPVMIHGYLHIEEYGEEE